MCYPRSCLRRLEPYLTVGQHAFLYTTPNSTGVLNRIQVTRVLYDDVVECQFENGQFIRSHLSSPTILSENDRRWFDHVAATLGDSFKRLEEATLEGNPAAEYALLWMDHAQIKTASLKPEGVVSFDPSQFFAAIARTRVSFPARKSAA